MIDREKIVDTLIDDDLEIDHFQSLLRNGFKGYNNFTDEELIRECEDRDISYLFGDDD